MELLDFLRARLDEDEHLARECEADVGAERADEPYPDGSGVADRDAFPSYPWGSGGAELAYMAGPGHPASVLREVEANRGVASLHYAWDDNSGDHTYLNQCAVCDETGPCDTVRLLALPYSNHPDYDAARWAP